MLAWDAMVLRGSVMKSVAKAARAVAKKKQASKIREIHRALLAAKFDTLDKQAAVLRLGRSTAWALLHSDKKVGPSNRILQHILATPRLPPTVRRKLNEYIRAKSRGLYGHSDLIIRTCVHDFNRASTSLRSGP
jgi:hypothetical protein